jgi:cytochrome oxidase assembly protein ShyY1
MYRFLWRPAWILSHVLILALIVAMVNLGLWQLRRLHERRENNAQVEQNTRVTPLALGDAVSAVDHGGIDPVTWRRVEIRGTYDTAHEVAIRGRSFDGAPGRWIATPLVPSGGGPSVLVVRGWVPEVIDDTDPPINGVEPPTGEVRVVGYIQPTQRRGTFGSVDRPKGTLHELSRVDVERFGRQYPGVVTKFWLQLSGQTPPTKSQYLQPVPLPEQGDGPHLSYAVQWGIFTLIAIIGYPIILRRVARQKADERRAEAAAAAGGDGDGSDEDVTVEVGGA